MRVMSKQDDGGVESRFFPVTPDLAGWRVRLRMSGTEYPVTVRWCNERCLCTTDGQHYLAEGIEELKLFW
jgi:hypothetical protein